MKLNKWKSLKLLFASFVTFVVLLLIFNADCSIKYGINMIDYLKLRTIDNKSVARSLKGTNIIVGLEGTLPLLFNNGLNENNIGILPDYMHSLSVALGAEIKTVNMQSKDLIKALQNNKISAAILPKDEAVKEGLFTSNQILNAKTRVLVLNDSPIKSLDDLHSQIVVMLKKDMGASSYDKHKLFYNKIKIVPMDNIYQCFALVNKGKAAGILCNDIESIYFAKVIYGPNRYRFVKHNLGETQYCLAVTQDNKKLIPYFNKSIVDIKHDGVYEQILEKWLGTYTPNSITVSKLNTFYKIFFSILLIIIILLAWNRAISKTVAARTKELSENKDELNSIINTINSGILVLSNENTILECNRHIEELVNQTKDLIIGRDYRDFDELKPFSQEAKNSILHNVDDKYYYMYSERFGEGNRLIIIDDYTKMYITERKERQESKMIALGQLVAGLAHEIRNPLGIIKSYVYLLKRTYPDELSQNAFSAIESNSDRINEFVTNLLTFSRLSKVAYEEINIDEVMTEIVNSFMKENDANILAITIDGSVRSEDGLYLNKSLLQMILINLIQNSIESYDDSATRQPIFINYSIDDYGLTIKVKDFGSGIPDEKIDEIFNPFFSTKDNGTGLGLYLISTEISSEGGNITVESSPENGTVFTVSLPNRKDMKINEGK